MPDGVEQVPAAVEAVVRHVQGGAVLLQDGHGDRHGVAGMGKGICRDMSQSVERDRNWVEYSPDPFIDIVEPQNR